MKDAGSYGFGTTILTAGVPLTSATSTVKCFIIERMAETIDIAQGV